MDIKYQLWLAPEPLGLISTLWVKTLASFRGHFADKYCLISKFMTEDDLKNDVF